MIARLSESCDNLTDNNHSHFMNQLNDFEFNRGWVFVFELVSNLRNFDIINFRYFQTWWLGKYFFIRTTVLNVKKDFNFFLKKNFFLNIF